MTSERIILAILVVATLLAIVRTLLSWRRQRAQLRAWRPLLLLLLQPLLATLLFLTLHPPERAAVPTGTLTVLTEGATSREVEDARGRGVVVALPEAGHSEMEQAPDLGTALRRYPDVARIHVAGFGLSLRDRDAATGLAIEASGAPLPAGLHRLDLPSRVVAGEALSLSGSVGGVAEARVELVDPAGDRISAAVVEDNGAFTLSAPMLASGEVAFQLRVLDADGAVVESGSVPLQIEEAALPRVLLLAGAPNPETRALQRWMQDAGFDVQARISLGAGMQVGDAPALSTERLQAFDLVVADARAWSELGEAGRASVLRAVDAGLGLLVRADVPVPVAAWRALGGTDVAINAGAAVETFRIGTRGVSNDAGADTGGANDVQADATRDPGRSGRAMQELTRRALRVSGSGAVPLVLADGGAPLGWWHVRGLGRIGLWAPLDTWRLPLQGRMDLYADLWSRAFSPLVRARQDLDAKIDSDLRVDERGTICGASDAAEIEVPDGTRIALLPDAEAQGCAAFWPRTAGWHRLHLAEQVQAFHVQAVDAWSAQRAAGLRMATQRLSLKPANQAAVHGIETRQAGRGSPWPWFAGWLLLAALTWWFERSRLGRIAGRA